MQKYFNKYIAAITGGIMLIMASSCKKNLDVPLPTNSLSTASSFTTKSVLDGMMNNLYSQLINNLTRPNFLTRDVPCLADDGYNPTSGTIAFSQTNSTSASGYTNNPVAWNDVYATIYTANTLLGGIPGSTAPGLTDDNKKSYIAAVKTIRAYAYFQLVRCFGDVPLILTTDVPANAALPREKAATVYAAIEKDLQDAVAALPATLGAKYFINHKYIPEAILAEVYLTEGKWALAEAAATDIISSNKYQLAALANVFLQSSNEGILIAPPVYSSGNNSNSFKVGGIAQLLQYPNDGTYRTLLEGIAPAMSPSLLASFETGDKRLTNWVTLRNAGGYADPNSRMFPSKYKYCTAFYSGTVAAGTEEEDKLIRLAEIYLLRAEARAQQNNTSGAAADLNVIRTRAGLANTTATSQTDLIDAVLNERRHELFFEGGYRWFDLVRTGKANAVLSVISYKATNWKPYMVLFPLAQSILSANANLTQTPGY